MENDKYTQRKERSEAMLSSGIEPILDGSEFWIPSQNDKGKRYKVTISGQDYLCQCPDHQNGNLCKHILLLKTYLVIKLQSKEQRVDVTHSCPHCESHNLQKDGTRKTTMGKKQRWFCQDCSKRFVNEPIQKIKGNMETVITAIDLYMKGVSYRGIADSLKQFYGLKISHVTVMYWVNNHMEQINNYVDTLQPKVGDKWHADEQFIKAKGQQEYVWNVLDNDTRFLLASNESKTRSYKDARETFQIAKKIAGKKATTVVTDGSFNYQKSVQKEFATYRNPKPHQRYVSIRAKDCSNNNIERFHGTFRQRDKVMKCFGGNQKQFADNFRTYYNFVKKHNSLGMTPSQKAGIDKKAEWKELLEEALSSRQSTADI